MLCHLHDYIERNCCDVAADTSRMCNMKRISDACGNDFRFNSLYIENINDLIEIFEEIAGDIDVNGQDRDFYEIRFMKEEIKTLLNCLKELKTE